MKETLNELKVKQWTNPEYNGGDDIIKWIQKKCYKPFALINHVTQTQVVFSHSNNLPSATSPHPSDQSRTKSRTFVPDATEGILDDVRGIFSLGW